MSGMTEEQFKKTCEFYGITEEEGRRRMTIVLEHTGDPSDPICVGCAKRPAEMTAYDGEIEDKPRTDEELAAARTRACIREEGTLNHENGHFLCDICYIKNGQPSSPSGWKCP
jgi:hypothetical protein